MLTEKRRRIILDLLEKEDTVHLRDLMEALGASESTVRRDLSLLEEEGTLIRVHGGAKRVYSKEYEPTTKEKERSNRREKECIGRYAASLVTKGETIYMDAGTTTLRMIPHLEGKDVTVITNGVQQAQLLADYGIKTVLLGGQVKTETSAVVGVLAQNQLREYFFKKAFLGMNGVDLSYGYTTPDEEEATIKKIAISKSNQAYVLADSSKFAKVSLCKVADFHQVTMVTNTTKEQADLRYRMAGSIRLVEMDA